MVLIRHFILLPMMAVVLCLNVSGSFGSTKCKPITKQNLISSLELGAKQKTKIGKYVELIEKCGVGFRPTLDDEKIFRLKGDYLGDQGLDKLTLAIRNNYRTGQNRPDVSLHLVYPEGFALLVMNNSDVVVRDPKYIPAIWNLDREPWNQPLPILVRSGDWIKAHEGWGPNAFLTQNDIAPLIKKGDRIVGVIGVTCPDCIRHREYWIYAVQGVGGWFAELPEGTHVNLVALGRALPRIREDPDKFFAAQAPVAKRIAIEKR